MLGDQVNLGARLEALTKEYGVGILVGESTAKAAGSTFVFREVDVVRVKGRAGAAPVFELVGRAGTRTDPRFAEALAAYRRRDFGEAEGLFAALGGRSRRGDDGEALRAPPGRAPSRRLGRGVRAALEVGTVARVPVLCLDFDGTMTDAEAEGRPFRDGYLEDLCLLVGRQPGDPEVLAIADATEAEIAAAPHAHPFLWMGRAVAPATVDPYLRMVPIAHRILDRFGAIPDATDRGRLLGSVLYKYNYAKTLGHPVFRPGAGEVLRALGGSPTWIVTNSDTHAVAGKVAALDRDTPGVAWLTSRVRGFARKFDVDDEWAAAPGEMALPGLDRAVLLRRRAYFEILAAVLEGGRQDVRRARRRRRHLRARSRDAARARRARRAGHRPAHARLRARVRHRAPARRPDRGPRGHPALRVR